MGGRRKTVQARPWTFKRRAKLLFKTLMDYMTDDGRQPIVAFIEKPSRKDYPNYYEVRFNLEIYLVLLKGLLDFM